MEVENIKKDVWARILQSSATPTFDFLALQMSLYRLRTKVKKDPSALEANVEELKKFFINNKKIPSAIKDLEKLVKLVG